MQLFVQMVFEAWEFNIASLHLFILFFREHLPKATQHVRHDLCGLTIKVGYQILRFAPNSQFVLVPPCAQIQGQRTFSDEPFTQNVAWESRGQMWWTRRARNEQQYQPNMSCIPDQNKVFHPTKAWKGLIRIAEVACALVC